MCTIELKKEILSVSGRIATPLMPDLIDGCEQFYQFILSVIDNNKSEVIPVIISEKLIDPKKNHIGEKVTVKGSYTSFYIDGKLPSIDSFSVRYLFPDEIRWD